MRVVRHLVKACRLHDRFAIHQRAAGGAERQSIAALRICAGARLVTEAWSSNDDTAPGNLQRELDCVGAIVAKIVWLVAHIDGLNLTELCHET